MVLKAFIKISNFPFPSGLQTIHYKQYILNPILKIFTSNLEQFFQGKNRPVEEKWRVGGKNNT